MAKVKVFRKAGQKVTVKVTRSSTSISLDKISLAEYTSQILVFSIYLLDLHGISRVTTLVKVFHMKIKGQDHKSTTFDMITKASSQEMYTRNMKALPLMVKTLWQRLKFLEM